MKISLYILFWVLFISHQVIQKGYGINIPFIHCYLDDFLLFPIILPFLQKIFWFFTKQQILPGFIIVFTVSFMTLMVEFYFPTVSDKFTFDWWDFAAYGLGVLVFDRVYNRKAKLSL